MKTPAKEFSTQAWLDKAESTFAAAQQFTNFHEERNYDAICLLSQYCAEQYLKARLQESKIQFSDCQPLPSLLNSTISVEPAWASIRQATESLLPKGSEFGYPGSIVNKEIAERALKSCGQIREIVRASLS